MKWGKVDYKQLKRLQQKIEKLEKQDRTKLCEEAVKEMATRMLAKLIKKTPVGRYPKSSGKNGGTLRKGWTSTSETEAMYSALFNASSVKVNDYVNTLKITKNGDNYRIELINPVEYASYVNNGHRTANHNGWVSGQFFIEISEKEFEAEAPKILEKKIQKYLEECFNE